VLAVRLGTEMTGLLGNVLNNLKSGKKFLNFNGCGAMTLIRTTSITATLRRMTIIVTIASKL